MGSAGATAGGWGGLQQGQAPRSGPVSGRQGNPPWLWGDGANQSKATG